MNMGISDSDTPEGDSVAASSPPASDATPDSTADLAVASSTGPETSADSAPADAAESAASAAPPSAVTPPEATPTPSTPVVAEATPEPVAPVAPTTAEPTYAETTPAEPAAAEPTPAEAPASEASAPPAPAAESVPTAIQPEAPVLAPSEPAATDPNLPAANPAEPAPVETVETVETSSTPAETVTPTAPPASLTSTDRDSAASPSPSEAPVAATPATTPTVGDSAPAIGDSAPPGAPVPTVDGPPKAAGPVEDPDFPGGTIVTGPALEVTAEEIVVDLGGGRQGVVSRRHFDESPPATLVGAIAPGDMVLGAVLIRDDPKGRVVLSRSWAVRKSAMDRMAKAQAEKSTIDAEVLKVVKGGLVLDVGIRGFLPRSLASLNPNDKLADLVGQTVTVRVLELDTEKNRVVLDRKSVLRKERAGRKAEILGSLKKNEIRSGVVKSIAEFGVFVDVGGAEGLVHLSELSWTRVEDPKSMVKVGDTVQVKVLEVRKSKGRIRLSMRATTPDPIERAEKGAVVEGTVTRLADFGAFVDIGGTEGLVHINQLSEHRVFTPDEVVIPGDRVFVKVIGVDRKRRRIDLSITQAVQSVSAPPVDPNAKVSESAAPVAEAAPLPEPADEPASEPTSEPAAETTTATVEGSPESPNTPSNDATEVATQEAPAESEPAAPEASEPSAEPAPDATAADPAAEETPAAEVETQTAEPADQTPAEPEATEAPAAVAEPAQTSEPATDTE